MNVTLFIGEGISQGDRLIKLNAIAISQMKLLTEDHRVNMLDKKSQIALNDNSNKVNDKNKE